MNKKKYSIKLKLQISSPKIIIRAIALIPEQMNIKMFNLELKLLNFTISAHNYNL